MLALTKNGQTRYMNIWSIQMSYQGRNGPTKCEVISGWSPTLVPHENGHNLPPKMQLFVRLQIVHIYAKSDIQTTDFYEEMWHLWQPNSGSLRGSKTD